MHHVSERTSIKFYVWMNMEAQFENMDPFNTVISNVFIT